jgi:hypothetical protein
MKSHVFGFALLTAAIVVASAPAQAQNGSLTRSFVSSTGNDGNSCMITAPCQSFAVAYTKIAPNGIIAALDPGKYGPLNIIGPVTVNGNGWAAITGPAGANAFTISAGPNDNVILTGIEIDGAGIAAEGVDFEAGGSLVVTNCKISNFNNGHGVGDGILFQPTSGLSTLTIMDTTVLNSGNTGIYITPRGSASVAAALDRDTTDLSNYGMYFDGSPTTGYVYVIVSESHVENNATIGMVINDGPNTQTMHVTVSNSWVALNAIQVSGEATLNVFLTHLVLSNGGFLTSGSPTVYTDGTNTGDANHPLSLQNIQPW